MRKVRITEEAYQAAAEIGQQMRKAMTDYRPNISLVTSALVLEALDRVDDPKEVISDFAIKMFEKARGTSSGVS